ncbi:MAG: SulP family inorganic anion transporter [Armatimonadetes bacterium]|nr:SulP family inorganic anion transporter [Armatimonadota bacterium]
MEGADRQYPEWTKFVPGLAALRDYDRATLGRDLLAGVSVAAVTVPVAMAYSQLIGLPPVTGLYAGMIAPAAYFLFGSSRQLVVGPDASTAALIGAGLASLAIADPSARVPFACAMAALAGVFSIAAGLLRLGFIANFLSKPILVGFLNGTGAIIIMGQASKLFGFPIHSHGFFRQLIELISKLGDTHVPTLAVGVCTFLLVRYLPRLTPKLPAALVAVVAAIAASILLRLDAHGVAVLGAVASGLPTPALPSFEAAQIAPLAAAALGIALISYTGTIVASRAFAAKNHYDIDANQELLGLGVADVAVSFFQGYAVAGSATRTAVGESAGGMTRVAGLATAVSVAAVLLFLTGPLAYLPSSALAAVLVSVALGIFDLSALRWLRRVRKPEFRLAVFTWLGVITIGVLQGVLFAVILAIIELLRRASHPRDAILGYSEERGDFYDVAVHPDLETIPGILIYRFNAPIVFFNADYFKTRVRAALEAADEKIEWFLLDAEMVSAIDATAAAMLEELQSTFAARGVTLAIARPSRQLREILAATGLDHRIGEQHMFANVRAGSEAFCAERPALEERS